MSKTRSASEEWTDVDVLAVEYSPLSGITFSLADCKTSRGRVTERVFWLKGVSELFGARASYLVRDDGLPASARQLALRLGIAALDKEDRAALAEQVVPGLQPRTGRFLAGETLVRWQELTSKTPAAIDRVQRYRQTYYWLLPRHRNLTQLPAYLGPASGHFHIDQRWSLALVVDLAWLYLLTVLDAVTQVTRLHLAESPGSLRQVLSGSEPEAREKQTLARQLAELLRYVDPHGEGAVPTVELLPPYFDELVDLSSRVARRRQAAAGALRALEFIGVETIANAGKAWTQAYPEDDGLSAKLASDTVRFLVRACDLDSWYVEAFDAAIEGALLSPSDSRSGQRASPTSQGELFEEPAVEKRDAEGGGNAASTVAPREEGSHAN
jgi:hypothetical protein